MNDYEVKFLEFNCDSPAGTAFSDVLEEGFKDVLYEYPFLSHWKIDYINRTESVFSGAKRVLPRIQANSPPFSRETDDCYS
jgi:hypothetical protein